jgi:hypothetical protein
MNKAKAEDSFRFIIHKIINKEEARLRKSCFFFQFWWRQGGGSEWQVYPGG